MLASLISMEITSKCNVTQTLSLRGCTHFLLANFTCPETKADWLTISSNLLNMGGVGLDGGVAFSGGETLLIGALTMMMRKAAAVSVTGVRVRKRRRRKRSRGAGGRRRSTDRRRSH